MKDFADGQFDVVLTVYTLRNFPDITIALGEMVRVLRPGGASLIVFARV
jgi:ubiquinone/menaquinone biosynthesis C-methylase UbiE